MPSAIGACCTIVAAIVAAVAATIGASRITGEIQRRRNDQDRESQWRTHAIELTKIDAERMLHQAKPTERLRPFILTFLANYRDLQELGQRTPGQLYEKILKDRINKPAEGPTIVLGDPPLTIISCAGAADLSGHPRIYMTLCEGEEVVCPYCSRRYLRATQQG